MTIITDTSYPVALYNPNDVKHQAAADFAFRGPTNHPHRGAVNTEDMMFGAVLIDIPE